jgi:hypothetical protein
MIINVTQEHIGKGIPGNACACPVSLAVEEAYPGYKVIAWELVFLNTDDTNCFAYQSLPPEVNQWQNLFDDINGREKVKPFSFELNDSAWELGDGGLTASPFLAKI